MCTETQRKRNEIDVPREGQNISKIKSFIGDGTELLKGSLSRFWSLRKPERQFSKTVVTSTSKMYVLIIRLEAASKIASPESARNTCECPL